MLVTSTKQVWQSKGNLSNTELQNMYSRINTEDKDKLSANLVKSIGQFIVVLVRWSL